GVSPCVDAGAHGLLLNDDAFVGPQVGPPGAAEYGDLASSPDADLVGHVAANDHIAVEIDVADLDVHILKLQDGLHRDGRPIQGRLAGDLSDHCPPVFRKTGAFAYSHLDRNRGPGGNRLAEHIDAVFPRDRLVQSGDHLAPLHGEDLQPLQQVHAGGCLIDARLFQLNHFNPAVLRILRLPAPGDFDLQVSAVVSL